MKAKLTFKPLKNKLTPLTGSRTPQEKELLNFIRQALKFSSSPWPVVASLWTVSAIDFKWLRKALVEVERYGNDNPAYRSIKEFLQASYRIGVNPLPILREHLPAWEWTYREMRPDEWDRFFSDSSNICIRDGGDIWWHWANNDYREEVFEVIGWYHRP